MATTVHITALIGDDLANLLYILHGSADQTIIKV